VAMYSVLDDLSKGFGTLFISMIVRLVGGRAVAYQISLLLWVLTGVALLHAWYTYDEDEAQMRRHLDEAALESMVLISKQRAQSAIRDRAKRAGEAHYAQKSIGARRDQLSDLQWPSSRRAAFEARMANGGAGSAWEDGHGSAADGVAAADGSTGSFKASHGGSLYGAASRRHAGHGSGRFCADRGRLHSAAQAAAEAMKRQP